MRTPAALLFCLPLIAAPPFTIEQVLSSPFPDNLVASPHGDAVAWVLNAQGVRNVWVARAPGFEAAPLTRFTADDGQELSDIAWKSDSTALFFTRGGGANGRGEFPNPQSAVAGVREEVWIAAMPGDARKIGDGHSPAVAPDGSMVAWIANGQIWATPLGPESKPGQLVHARGTAGQLVWSPDSSRLAFASNRGDHGFIGVYDARGKSLTFMDPSVDRDESPVWSADSERLAFIRVLASRYAFMFGPKRTAEPWSIRMAEVKSGRSRELWRAGQGMGSVFWPMVANNQLLWGDNRIVFPWERDGWLHLYSIPSAGGDAKELTPGNFEIEHVALTSDGRTVIYSSNQNDIDRRHLWRVAIGGGSPGQLTQSSAI